MQFHIKVGDDGKCTTKGVGTVSFKRESSSLLHFRNVMYVPILKKSLVSLVVLEYKGCDVVLNIGKAYLKHSASGQVK